MLTIEKYPRCKAYLAKLWVKPPYHGQTDYWLAVCIAESFSDEYLAKIGTVNFDTMTGAELLPALEEILARRAGKKPAKPKGKAKAVPVAKIMAAVSNAEIEAAMTPKGGWKASTLAAWGVAWPPPRGWRQKLVANYQAMHGT